MTKLSIEETKATKFTSKTFQARNYVSFPWTPLEKWRENCFPGQLDEIKFGTIRIFPTSPNLGKLEAINGYDETL